jgi:ATP-dependent helicase HrpB
MLAWRYAHQHGFRLEACQRLGIHAGAARQVAPLFQQFLRVAEEQGLVLNERAASQEAIRQCVLTAFIDQLALRRDEGTLRCDLVHGWRGELARDSAVRHSRLFVASEIDEIEHGNHEFNVILRLATAVEEAWLAELFSEAFSERTEVAFDASGKRVISKQLTCFRDLVLKTKLAGTPPAEAAAALLARAVLTSRFTLKAWTPAVDQWICRLIAWPNGAPSSGCPLSARKNASFSCSSSA